jgi:hypothetical protein
LLRINQFYEKNHIKDSETKINGIDIPSLKELLLNIDWQWLCDGYASSYHGDFNLSNIIIDKHNKFKFVDFRQDFGGIFEYGDKYYDFAKLYHGLIWPHTSIKCGNYIIDTNHTEKQNINATIDIPTCIEKCKFILDSWCVKNEMDLKKIKILTGLILLNMSPLHEYPIDKHLYFYGKYNLWRFIND